MLQQANPPPRPCCSQGVLAGLLLRLPKSALIQRLLHRPHTVTWHALYSDQRQAGMPQLFCWVPRLLGRHNLLRCNA